MKKHWIGTGIALPLAGVCATVASAQEAPAPSTELEAVVVTAQKRKEDVKEIPISVSVLSGEMLKDNQIADFSDISRAIPNVSFMAQAGPGLSTLEIRGVTSIAGSATVGVYLDDVSLTTRNLYSQGVAEPRFFDIGRVEVLRGPQGTLYGAGSEGGTIRFISNQPDTAEFTSSGVAEVSQTQHGGVNTMVQGVVNAPLSNTTALRVGLQEGHQSGWVDQLSPKTLDVVQAGINGQNWNVEKAALKSKLDNDWSVTAAFFGQQFRTSDIDGTYTSLPAYQVGNGQTGSNGQTLGAYETTKIVREPGQDHLYVTSFTVNGDVGFGDLTGIFSNYKRFFTRIQDGTAVNSNYIACQLLVSCGGSTGVSGVNGATNLNSGLVAAVNGLPSLVYLDNTINSNAIELRLASKDYEPGKGAFTWIVGTYLSHTKTDVTDSEPVYGINAAFQAAYPGNANAISDPTVLGGAYAGDFPGDNSYYSARHYDDRQMSFFGEITTHFSPDLRLITGLRWVDAKEDFHREGAWYFSGFSSITSATPQSTNSAQFTPRVSLDWDIHPTTTLYTTAAKGARVGGANRPVPLAFQPSNYTPSFGPDSLWSYEVGSKSRFWDRKVSFNMAAYHILWKNIQQDLPTPTGGFDFETNVGHAEVNGVEADTTVRVTSGLTLMASGNFTRAVFTDDVPAIPVTSGQNVQGVPKTSLHLGAEDRFPVASDLNGIVRLNGNWTGTSQGQSFNPTNPDFHRPGYFTSDFSASLLRGRWDLAFFIKNLNGNRTPIQQMPIQFLNEALYLRPRTIGLNLTGEF